MGDDGSFFEVIRHRSDELFQKYKLIVPPNDEPDYETCKECGHRHNELAHRTHNDIKTGIDVISEHFGKGKVRDYI